MFHQSTLESAYLPSTAHTPPPGQVVPSEATAVTQTGCPRTPGAQIKADHPHRTPLAHRGDGPPAGPSGACGPRAVSSQLTRLAGPGALSLDLILPGVELGFSLAAQMFRQ